MRPSRPVPYVGMPVTVRHLAVEEAGVVHEVTDEGRRLGVVTATGERFEFLLSRTTARYQAPACGPFLELPPEPA